MNKHNILFIGLDTHKEFVEVAYIEEQYVAQAIHFVRVSIAKTSITKLARQFQSKYSGVTSCVLSSPHTFCIDSRHAEQHGYNSGNNEGVFELMKDRLGLGIQPPC